MSHWNNEDEQTYRPPEWLTHALGMSERSDFGSAQHTFPEPSPLFDGRCQEAAEAALGVARLRAERQRVGFVPLPFSDYVNGLVKLAGVQLSPVLTWLGLETLAAFDPKVITAYARLARSLGMSLREAATHIRISFAAQVGSAPVTLLMARRRSASAHRNPLETSEAALREIEAEYDPARLVELHQIESELNAAYAGAAGVRAS